MRYRYEIIEKSAVEAEFASLKEADQFRQGLLQSMDRQLIGPDGVPDANTRVDIMMKVQVRVDDGSVIWATLVDG